MDSLTFFAPIEKTDKKLRMVYGYASTEAVDSQNEVVKKEALSNAIDDYMKWANIREMHQPIAVGKTKKAQLDNKGLYIAAKIVDDAAWKKVEEGVYNGFSIGGRVKTQKGNEITGITLSEISIVDRPANPECKFDVFKADMLNTKKRDFSQKERDQMAEEGKALPDGSFPIANVEDLKNAISAYGRAKDKEEAKKHIIARAKALKATDELPADWEGSTKEEKKVEQVEMKKEVHTGAMLANAAAQLDDLADMKDAQGEDMSHISQAKEAVKEAAIVELQNDPKEEDEPEHQHDEEKGDDMEDQQSEDENAEDAETLYEEDIDEEDDGGTTLADMPSDLIKVEENIKKGIMPNEKEIAAILTYSKLEKTQKNIDIVKWEMAGKIMKNIQNGVMEKHEADKAIAENKEVKKDDQTQGDNAVTPEKAEEARTTITEQLEQLKALVAQLSQTLGVQVNAPAKGTETETTDENDEKEENGVKAGSTIAGSDKADKPEMKKSEVVKLDAKAQDEKLAKVEGEVLLLKGQLEKLMKAPLAIKAKASYMTVNKSFAGEEVDEASQKLAKARKRAEELEGMLKMPHTVEIEKEAADLSLEIMKLQRLVK